MRDKERGVVWEESIILLPHKVRFVFLSATIPNAKEFVGWVAKTHHQPCHVVYTDYRYLPSSSSSRLFLLTISSLGPSLYNTSSSPQPAKDSTSWSMKRESFEKIISSEP